MRVVKVNKQELFNVLHSNMKIHEAKYKDAMCGYRVAVIGKLELLLNSIKDGGKIKTEVDMPDPEPESHVKDYETAIRMVEMNVEDVIELTDLEFKQYVMDEWSWSVRFSSSSSSYSTSTTSSS